VIVSGPVSVLLHSVTAAAPSAVTGPVMVAPLAQSAPPGCTVTGPVTTPVTQSDCPDATFSDPLCGKARHGPVKPTRSCVETEAPS
jgi:hypothetical protein